MKNIVPIIGEYPLDTLRRCGGYYKQCTGGPLVGYAGRDEQKRQFVGFEYVNFAKAERHGSVLKDVAIKILRKFPHINTSKAGFCGAPEGGKALAATLATITGRSYIFPEKKVTVLKSENSREQSTFVWSRHEPEAGEEIFLVEDVCNNFSTTADMIRLIESKGALVVGIICFLNRSLSIENEYSPYAGRKIPVYALVRQLIAEYKQDDPEVSEYVAKGNVIWKPKDEWDKLPQPE